jgi:hypothetical protein
MSLAAPDARPEEIFIDVEGVSPADLAISTVVPAASAPQPSP